METRLLEKRDAEDNNDVTVEVEPIEPLELLITDKPWLQDLCKQVALPTKYQFRSHDTGAFLFASVCAAAASFLYIKGGESEGMMAEVGGVSVNFIQNLLYGISSYFFIKESICNFNDNKVRLTSSVAIAGLATVPSIVSAYQITDNSFITSMTAIGNLPNNIFGMYTSINRLVDAAHDNSRLRDYLLNKLRTDILCNDFFKYSIEDDLHKVNKIMGGALGTLLGLVLVGAQTGFICSSSKFGVDIAGKESGILLGLLANLPSAAIALLISGWDIGMSSANLMANLYHYISGNKKLSLNAREIKLLSAFIFLTSGFSCLSYYSSTTSNILYNQNCPSFGNIGNDTLSFIVDKGTFLSNAIMSGIAISAGLNYQKVAYADEKDSQRYKMTAMSEWIKFAPIKKVESIAEKYFKSEISAWKKPEPPVKAPSTSLFGGLWYKNNIQSQPLEANKQEKQSCLIM